MSATTQKLGPNADSRILLVGATGTIGRATVRALVRRGREVVCFGRPNTPPARLAMLEGAEMRYGDVTHPASLASDGFCGERFECVVSCLASRTGAQEDAWAIDYQAHMNLLDAAKAAGVPHFVLLSAICVQKPALAFQHAKLAFERALIASGMDYTIVRPTAFFKSLSGQVARVMNGKSWLLFGDGALTACKPISDDDMAEYLADCVERHDRRNRILQIGGPGAAITPKELGEALFTLLGRAPRFTHVPVRMMDAIIGVLTLGGRVFPALKAKAELARIGRYYATESMLVWDPATGRYDANATLSTGSETLLDYYARLVREEVKAERGDHAVF